MARLHPKDRKPNDAGKRSHDAGAKRNGKSKKKQKVGAADVTAAAVAAPEQEDSKSLAATTLKELLGGMDLDTFFSEYFEKKPLHVRSNGKHKLFPHDLFSKKKVLETIQVNELDYGKDLTICKYVDETRENYDGDGEVSVSRKKVARLFDRHYSCQFYQPQRYIDGLFKINAAFEAYFGCLAGASAYLTPPAAQALAPHHDDVEVFILQTEGRKKWKLYHPITELAGEHSNDLSPDQIGAPWMELTLEEGDLLYFPRGVVHQAATDDKQFSTHVTISVYQHNAWANFLEVALPRIIRRAFDSNVDFRRGLPVGYLEYMGSQFPSDSKQAQEFTETLKNLIGKLAGQVESTDLQQAADEAAMDFFANRLPPMDESEQDMSISPLDGKVGIRFKDRSHVRLTMGEDEEKEAFVAVYYSSKNCRVHHMGLCSCRGNFHDEDGGSDEGSDGEGEGEDGGHDGSDGEGSDDDEGDFAAAMGQVPVQPQSIAFPGELAQPLMKLYSSYPKFVSVNSLDSDESDETAVRGMLLRLWSEGLLEVSKQ
uniref:Bifunctional lysine-specific demethylase and histidyl-hydroxylase n=1 Tax=Globisporangium ultimum (strain ATCC 200006 / CBS 805.95 / DAOM BR144) TaxID=431595 RepID=K3WPR5_GLOUD